MQQMQILPYIYVDIQYGICYPRRLSLYAPVAQLDRATDF